MPVKKSLFIVVSLLLALNSRGTTSGAQNTVTSVSAATYAGSPLAGESIAAAFGTGLATATAAATILPLPTSLAGTRVKVRDSAGNEQFAPLFFVSPNQINYQIPPGAATGAATVTVTGGDGAISTGSLQITSVAPGLFSADASGQGLPAATVLRVRQGGQQSWEPVGRFDQTTGRFVPAPIDMGAETDQLFLALYGTGIRNAGARQTTARIGGVDAEVVFAGAQGGFVGLDQVNLKLPRNLKGRGEVDVVLTVEGQPANVLRVMIAGGSLYLANKLPVRGAISTGSGVSTLSLSADERSAIIRFSYTNLTTPVSGTHIHGPADPEQNGQLLFDIDEVQRQLDGSYIWIFAPVGSVTVPQIVTAIKTGRVYIDVHSARYPGGEIRGHYGLISGSQQFTPPPSPPQLPGGPPTANDAARFLTQATYGPKMAEITTLSGKGFNIWLNQQFQASIQSHVDYLMAARAAGEEVSQNQLMESIWKQAITGDDQLRQRVALALSEIMVISGNSDSLSALPWAMASWMDMLNRNAFGNFRQLLEDVTLHPAMGSFLNMLGNDKGDPEAGINPNENYAREILQLFSIGLYQLHPDGSLKLDNNGAPIPTYDQNTIKELSKVFTGWSFGGGEPTWERFYGVGIYDDDFSIAWRVPMQVYEDHHSPGSKRLLNGFEAPAGQTAQKDLKDALDNIFNHPNVGPFIARRLIQRLVTSNPSRGYVYRVARAFDNNGQGARGDLRAVIPAILTDYEARSVDLLNNQGYGKLREPIVRFGALLRAFNAKAPNGKYRIWYLDDVVYGLGQNPLRAPSVFNFFTPDYIYPGPLAAAGLYAPEFQITTETTAASAANLIRLVAYYGYLGGTGEDAADLIALDYSSVLPLAANPAQMIDYLNLLLMSGSMSSGMRNILINTVSLVPTSEPSLRAQIAVHLIVTSPEFVIQK